MIAEVIDQFKDRQDDYATLTYDGMIAGLLIRKRVRAAFDSARLRGVLVEVVERKGWLESVFTVRLRGRAGDMLPTLYQLEALEEE